MSNGDIDEAQLEAILDSGQEAVNRYVATGVFQLTRKMSRLSYTCEQRGKSCPAVLHDRAGKAVVQRVVDRIGLPLVLVGLTIGLTKLFS